MTDEENLQASNDQVKKEIVSKGPAAYLTRRQRIESRILKVVVVGMFAGLVGVVVDHVATDNVAACTNTQLGSRNGASDADAKADIAWAKASATWSKALKTVLTFPSATTQAQKQAAVVSFVTASGTYASAAQIYTDARTANEQYRLAHPLGTC